MVCNEYDEFVIVQNICFNTFQNVNPALFCFETIESAGKGLAPTGCCFERHHRHQQLRDWMAH